MIRRRALALLLAIGLAPTTCLQEPAAPRLETRKLDFAPLKLPPRNRLGPFVLEGVWSMTSTDWRFGSYSALVALGDGRLLALSDRGNRLVFAPPGAAAHPPEVGMIIPAPKGRLIVKWLFDAESATLDPETGQLWIGWENDNTITRHDPGARAHPKIRPAVMRAWGNNSGPEAMTRLADGRFVVLREGSSGWLENRRHQGLLFGGDPTSGKLPQVFTFVGEEGFDPTDMAQLPDGRVLILMRRLRWPVPARFTARIVIADPAAIDAGKPWRGKLVARLDPPLPVDNFEGMAIEPRADGKVTVWLISDDNGAALQRTLLWKLAVDPRDLPGQSKRARGASAAVH